MKYLFYLVCCAFLVLSPLQAQEDPLNLFDGAGDFVIDEERTPTGVDDGFLIDEEGTPTGVDVGDIAGPGGNFGPRFTAELNFVENFLESNYILTLSLLVGIIGFWQFFVLGKGFGVIMIIMALGLTAFPGVYKGFYAGTRSFVHEAAGTGQTQGWQ